MRGFTRSALALVVAVLVATGVRPSGADEFKTGDMVDKDSIANKISRGTFSATFLLATLKAIEADVIRLEAV